MRSFHRAMPILLFAALAVVLVGGSALLHHTTTQVIYFPETGHSVRAPFLDFFTHHGGTAFFGYPLTEPYSDSTGATVQVFQRVQLCLTPHGVELAPIGTALWLSEPSTPRDGAPEGSRYISRTGHAIATELLSFYDERGGEAFFGTPIGEARAENGALVQDFERARLILNAQGEYELGLLGSAFIDVYPPPTTSTILAAPPHEISSTTAIHAHVYVQRPTVERGGQQTIYLVVQDEEGQAIENAQSLAVLRYADASAELELAPTNQQGIASATFIVPPAPPSTQVVVELYVLVGDTFLTVETAYIQWW